MCAGSKAAAFAIILRIFVGRPGRRRTGVAVLVRGVAALTMVWGNIAAMPQHNVKRMLAYSSIAHAGYVLIGLVAGDDAGRPGVVLYLPGLRREPSGPSAS